MFELVLGIAGFGLYLLYDINSFSGKNKLLSMGFFAGCALIAAATVSLLLDSFRSGFVSGAADWALMILGAAMFALLIYCLFFALPFEETYVSPEEGRKVYDGGAYALCRHPGVLCFFAMYLFAGLAALPGRLLSAGMVFSVLNVLYALLQDRVTFPKTFSDYGEYRKRVPFLIPNKESVLRAAAGCRGGKGKEEKK